MRYYVGQDRATFLVAGTLDPNDRDFEKLTERIGRNVKALMTVWDRIDEWEAMRKRPRPRC